MDLAERLHMTLSQLLANADSRELGLWMAKAKLEAEESHTENKNRELLAKATGARKR